MPSAFAKLQYAVSAARAIVQLFLLTAYSIHTTYAVLAHILYRNLLLTYRKARESSFTYVIRY